MAPKHEEEIQPMEGGLTSSGGGFSVSSRGLQPEPEFVTLEANNRSFSRAPVPKVWAASSGAVSGGAIAVMLPWLSKTYLGIEMPVEVALAIGAILSWAGSFAAGYFTPPHS